MNPTTQKPLLNYAICVLLVVVTFAAFVGVAHCSFITMDDRVYVVANPPVAHGFSWSSVKWAFQTFHGGYWIPVTWFSHMLDCQLYGLNPAGHHVTNLIFHVANTILLFLLMQKLTARLWPSAFVALLFGIHPMHVESVAWVAERKDVLSAFFFLLTLLVYTRYAELASLRRPGLNSESIAQTSKPGVPQVSKPADSTSSCDLPIWKSAAQQVWKPALRCWLAYAAAIVLFALGLMSKPMLVTLPFVLLLLDFWPLGRFNALAGTTGEAGTFQRFNVLTFQRLFVEKLPFFLLAAAFSYITFLTQRSAGAVKPVLEFSIAGRLGHAAFSYVWYLLKFFWPTNLSIFYPFHTTDLALEILSASVLLAITAFALARARKSPYLLFGWLWFLGMLFPVIGLLQAGEQAYADRFAYLPYIGLFIIIAWGIPDLVARMRPQPSTNPSAPSGSGRRFSVHSSSSPFLCAAAAAIAVACFTRTFQEVGYWKDGVILCQRAIALDPRNGYVWMALGAEYSNRHNFDEAIDCMTRATTLDPKLDLAWQDLGKLLFQKGNYSGAENAYQTALKCTWSNGNKIEIYNDLGDSLASAGTFESAIAAYQNSLGLNPNQPITQTKLGQCFLQTQEPDLAASAFKDAIDLQPDDAVALAGLGMISQSSGVDSEAVAEYRKALEADPASLIALNNLAWLLATDSDSALRNGHEAVSLAEYACQLTHYERAFMIGTLAAAYAEAGRFDDAIAAAQKARTVALTHGDNGTAARNAQLLQLYKSHKPFRDETSGGKTKR